MPKRLWTASALVLIITSSVIMIFSGSLDGAAAWANIIALPVAAAGTYLTLRRSSRVSESRDQDGVNGRGASAGGGPAMNQNGYTSYGDVIQVGRDYIVQSQPGSDGR
ncbi:hypothetical protein [Plantactinospora soyae]|uniref:Uncharacterized protein n=1 Tax=Plantactinospora soyae TaxID=1544732 RepID=A0A927RC79_9ACTN|nr:hypothetical protein [Plantactinospora soyae]MBE1492391.1 hypothetical protein [Plantactinospora soyae]